MPMEQIPPEFRLSLEKLIHEVRNAVTKTLQSTGPLLVQEAQRLTDERWGIFYPFTSYPNAKDHYKSMWVVDIGEDRMSFYNLHPWFLALERPEGVRPHMILPRKSPYLVFWSDRWNTMVRARQVSHPGYRGLNIIPDAAVTVFSRDFPKDMKINVEEGLRRAFS